MLFAQAFGGAVSVGVVAPLGTGVAAFVARQELSRIQENLDNALYRRGR